MGIGQWLTPSSVFPLPLEPASGGNSVEALWCSAGFHWVQWACQGTWPWARGGGAVAVVLRCWTTGQSSYRPRQGLSCQTPAGSACLWILIAQLWGRGKGGAACWPTVDMLGGQPAQAVSGSRCPPPLLLGHSKCGPATYFSGGSSWKYILN